MKGALKPGQKQLRLSGRGIQRMIASTVIFHVVLWALVLLILTVLISLNGNWPFSFYLVNMLVTLPAMILFSYLMNGLSTQFLFRSNHFFFFLLSFVCCTIACSLLVPVLHHFILFGLFFPRIFEPSPWFNWRHIPQNLILLWLPYFILAIRSFFLHWFHSEQEKLIIENKRLLAEIQLMKVKLHPHFLFNTLNNLYAMAKKNCENTSEYLLKLSEIYRTMLYECDHDFFPVNNELLLIRNYIDLEKIRYDERLNLELCLPEQLADHLMMPPLLFFTFVENAFKHGCRHDVGHPFVKISLEDEPEFLVFRTENSVPGQIQDTRDFGGFGLENTRKRLELVYENEFEFHHRLVGNKYEVYLKLPKLLEG